MVEEIIDTEARCVYCGTQGLRRLHDYIVICPCCGKVLIEHGDFDSEERSIWEEEQAFKIPLVKRRRGSRKSGRKRSKRVWKRYYPLLDV